MIIMHFADGTEDVIDNLSPTEVNRYMINFTQAEFAIGLTDFWVEEI